MEADFEQGLGGDLLERDARNDKGEYAHLEGLFAFTVAFLYRAGFAVVMSLSPHLQADRGVYPDVRGK